MTSRNSQLPHLSKLELCGLKMPPPPFPTNPNFLDYYYYSISIVNGILAPLPFKILSLLVESPFFTTFLQFFQVCDPFGRSRINFLQRWELTTVLQGVKENYFHWYAKVIKRNSFLFNVSKFTLLTSFILLFQILSNGCRFKLLLQSSFY